MGNRLQLNPGKIMDLDLWALGFRTRPSLVADMVRGTLRNLSFHPRVCIFVFYYLFLNVDGCVLLRVTFDEIDNYINLINICTEAYKLGFIHVLLLFPHPAYILLLNSKGVNPEK